MRIGKKSNLKFCRTNRGFGRIDFTDRYNESCSLQASSLATEAAIWLGINDAHPQIMASDAIRLGIDTNHQTTGWVPFDIPSEVLMSTRMHLTQKEVRELLPLLQRFAETGEF